MRSRSAPPVCLKDVGPLFYLRDWERSELFMDPRYLAKFSPVFEIGRTNARVIMHVEGKILKLYPNLVDVSVIVSNMNLARTKVPVPRVYDYGYSGNCAYILMEGFLETLTAEHYINMMGCAVPKRLGHQVRQIVADLASVGLSHNDLYPRNLLVNRFWQIITIIDWDDCTGIEVGGEYARRVTERPEMHDWDYIFLKHSLDRTGEILLSGDMPTDVYRQPPLARYPLGRDTILGAHRSDILGELSRSKKLDNSNHQGSSNST
jgi:hypothetical protein